MLLNKNKKKKKKNLYHHVAKAFCYLGIQGSHSDASLVSWCSFTASARDVIDVPLRKREIGVKEHHAKPHPLSYNSRNM